MLFEHALADDRVPDPPMAAKQGMARPWCAAHPIQSSQRGETGQDFVNLGANTVVSWHLSSAPPA
jgi:hypothetical protein